MVRANNLISLAHLLDQFIASAAQLLKQARHVDVEVADVDARRLVHTAAHRRADVGQLDQDRFQFGLALHQLHHQRLFGAHVVGQGFQLLRHRDQVSVGADPILLATGQGSLQILEAFCGLFEERLNVSRYPLIALIGEGPGRQARDARQPIFEVIVESILRLSRLQVEETEDKRTREPEEGRRERRAHTGERALEATLEVAEDGRQVAAGDRQAADDVANRTDGAKQAPEGAEETEEDEKTDGVTRYVTRFIQA